MIPLRFPPRALSLPNPLIGVRAGDADKKRSHWAANVSPMRG